MLLGGNQSLQKALGVKLVVLFLGPRYSAGSLGEIARQLDATEHALGLSSGNESQNVDASGNFSITVIEKALSEQGLQVQHLFFTNINF